MNLLWKKNVKYRCFPIVFQTKSPPKVCKGVVHRLFVELISISVDNNWGVHKIIRPVRTCVSSLLSSHCSSRSSSPPFMSRTRFQSVHPVDQWLRFSMMSLVYSCPRSQEPRRTYNHHRCHHQKTPNTRLARSGNRCDLFSFISDYHLLQLPWVGTSAGLGEEDELVRILLNTFNTGTLILILLNCK